MKPSFHAGFFYVSWYGIMYLIAFAVVYILIRYRIKTGEWKEELKTQNLKPYDILLDFLLYAFFGLVIGARLGEVFFYNFPYYWAHPIRIISPFDPATHKFIGIYGMSYYGGLIGVVLATIFFTRKYKISFWQWADFVIPAIPLGYFFGRLGNFINGELYGRATSRWWGMYFPGDQLQLLRHPSQIYEAILEGLVLFFILWKTRNKKTFSGYFFIVYLGGYAIFRFIAEFWREPDVQIGFLTLGQILSLVALLSAVTIFWNRKENLL